MLNLCHLELARYKYWKEAQVCNNAIKHICSGGMLRNMGYDLSLLRVLRLVNLIDEQKVIVAKHAENEMAYASLIEMTELPNLNLLTLTALLCEVHLSDHTDAELVDINLHIHLR